MKIKRLTWYLSLLLTMAVNPLATASEAGLQVTFNNQTKTPILAYISGEEALPIYIEAGQIRVMPVLMHQLPTNMYIRGTFATDPHIPLQFDISKSSNWHKIIRQLSQAGQQFCLYISFSGSCNKKGEHSMCQNAPELSAFERICNTKFSF